MRLRICLGLLVLAALALALKVRYLSGVISEQNMQTVIAIDVGASIALLIYTLAILSSQHARLKELIRGLIAFRAGRREYRAPVRGGDVLSELAKGINKILAGDEEEEVSGPVGFRRVVRPSDATDPRMRAKILGVVGSPDAPAMELDPGEEVGPVRRRPREPQPDDTQGIVAPVSGQSYDTEVSGPRDSVVEAHHDPEPAPAAEPDQRADDQDAPAARGDTLPPQPSAVDEPAEDEPEPEPVAAADSEPEAEPEPEPRALPSETESGVAFAPVLSTPGAVSAEDDDLARRELYETFIAEKARLGEPTDDLDFGGFEQLLEDVASQLKVEEDVEQVRFDIRVHDGKVALQPRLVRNKI